MPTRSKPCAFIPRPQRRTAVLLEKMASVPKEQRPWSQSRQPGQDLVAAAYEARKAELTAAAESADFIPLCRVVTKRPARCIRCFRCGTAHRDFPAARIRAGRRARYRERGLQFDALNTPPDHPARNEQDTFYLKEDGLTPSLGLDGKSPGGRRLMRTQTSTVQIHTMLGQPPPIRIIAPGRCYRRDEIDATHGMSFFQMEGLSSTKA